MAACGDRRRRFRRTRRWRLEVVDAVMFTCVGSQVRPRHVPSMEGTAIAKSTVALLNCSSTFSMNRTVSMSSAGADTIHNLTVPMARSYAGSKSRREM
eukprot:4664484-Pleurochrysis_carterae.AAC.1